MSVFAILFWYFLPGKPLDRVIIRASYSGERHFAYGRVRSLDEVREHLDAAVEPCVRTVEVPGILDACEVDFATSDVIWVRGQGPGENPDPGERSRFGGSLVYFVVEYGVGNGVDPHSYYSARRIPKSVATFVFDAVDDHDRASLIVCALDAVAVAAAIAAAALILWLSRAWGVHAK